MANFTSVHTGATIDASVTIISSSGVTQSDLTKLNAVTSSAVELNILDGVTASTAEINILDGLTASTTELNYLDGADSSITTLSLPDNTTITTFGASLIDDADAATARTTLGVDVAGTDNSTDVTLVTTSHDYLSISGQAITLGQIDISDDTNLVGGDGLALTGDTLSVNVDDSSIEINSDTLRVKASGVTNAMLANSSLSYGGVSVALGSSDATPAFDLSDATSLPIVAGTTGTLSVARGGTGATTASDARTNLNVDVAGTDNSTDVTLVTTSHDYLSLSGQAITLGTIDIGDDTNLVGGTGITLTGDTLSTTDSEIVHDNLSGFVSNEHIDHSTVSITAGTGLSGGGDITTSRTLTTDDSAIVHDNLSGFVANEHIDHSGVSITAGAGLTGGGDITATRDIAVGAGTGVTVNADDIAIGQDVGTTQDVTFNSVTADIIGDIRGATKFQAKADVALNKGDAVYISGVSGTTPTVDIADANDSAKMPSFGLAASSVSINASVEIITFGTLAGLNTSGFSVGDILFISTNGTSGNTLTATAPTGESSLIQNIGIVQRSHASSGSIKVGGAGRTNATPNLDDGDIFIGNGSNQAVTASLNTKIEDYLDGGTSTANFDTISVDGAEITATPAELNVLDGITSTTAELNYTDGVTSNIQTQLDAKAPLASPAFTGTATGANLTLSGDLTVNGSTTTLDTTNLAVEDNLMELNAGVTSNANDSGFLIERGTTGDNAIFMWDESADKFTLGTTTATGTTTGDITLSSTGTLVANVEGDVTGAVTGNADTATTLATARNFSLTGDVTAGVVSFDGSGNVALSTTIAANSVALGTDTTGNYMSDLTEGTGIDISHTPGEGSNGTITLDLTEVGFGGGANRLITDDGDGTVSTEANLTFDGSSNLNLLSDSGKLRIGADSELEIYHNGTNDFIDSGGTAMFFRQGTTEKLKFNSAGNIQFNNAQADINTRFGTTGSTNTLWIDGGTDSVGIGNSSPYERLYVQCEDATSPGIVSNPAATNGAVAYAIGYGDANKDYLCTWGMEFSGGGNVIGFGVKPSTTTAGAFINSADNSNFARGALLIDNKLRFFNAGEQTGTKDTAITMTERFTVDSSGNVGIGTNSPGEKLTIKAGGDTSQEVIKIRNSSNTEMFSFGLDSSGDGYLNFNTSPGTINTNGGDLVLSPGGSGNVGIGTTAPSFKLKVNVDNGTYTDWETIAAFQTKRSADSETEAGIMINSLGDALGGQISSNYYWSDNVAARGNTGRSGAVFGMANNAGAAGTHSSFYWQTSPNNSNTLTDRMILDTSGNLLIGASSNRTTVSGYSPRLNTEGAGAAGYVQIVDNENSQFHGGTLALHKYRSGGIVANTELGSLYFGGTDSANSTYAQGALIKAYAQGTDSTSNVATDLAFFTNTGSAMTRAMTIDDSQNVGIGVVSPSGKLHVSGDSYFTGGNVGVNTTNPRLPLHVASTDGDDDPASASATGAFFVTNSAGSYGLHMGVSSDGSGWIQSQSVTSANEYNLNLNPIGGNVGIGVTSPGTYNVQLASGYKIGVDTSSGGTTRIAEIEFYNTGDGSLRLKTDNSSTGGIEFHTEGSKRVEIDKSGDVLPGADGTQDLGSSSKRWGVIYSADLDLSNEGSQNDVDGTWGSYVIQEGEEDLFLINRRNGKKYKFMLQEVQD
jgi:hypothetical protein